MKYYVTYKIDGRYVAEVEADSIAEAIDEAEAKYCDADFGAVKCIEGVPIIVEDENERYVWKR